MARSTELTRNRDYLAQNRRMIIGRSLAAGLAGALPIPLVEEWISATIQRSMIRRIADQRHVDMDAEAIKAVADGPYRAPEWAEVASGRILARLLRHSWRRLLLAVLAVRRLQSSTRSFLVATLFDHYCARLHLGLGLDAASGAEVRSLIDASIAETPGGLGRRIFQRALMVSARASLRAPLELLDWASGGAVRRLLKRKSEVEAIKEVDEALEKQLRSQKSFLSRTVVAVELELGAEGNPYISRLLDVFELKWRERHPDPERR